MSCDVLITGTGMFAGRIALDIAATAKEPINVVIAGRNRTRLDWLRTAGNARAAMFGTAARFSTQEIDLLEPSASAGLLRQYAPKLVVQAASIQTSTVISDKGSRWTDLVAKGGLSATAVFQAVISARMAAAISEIAPDTKLINCSFPDVVNSMIVGLGHRVLCGTGNVAILSNIFAGARDALPDGKLRVLAHYQCLAPWRLPSSERSGLPSPRVFIGDDEIQDPFEAFASCKLTPEPAIEISGASGVTLICALVAGKQWEGHVPGPNGLPGGYPVRLESGELMLDLPQGLSEQDAIAWNEAFEERKGMTVSDGAVRYHGRLKELLEEAGTPHAQGFALSDLERVSSDLITMRDRLMNLPSETE